MSIRETVAGWAFASICLVVLLVVTRLDAGEGLYRSFLVSPNPNLAGAADCPMITFQSWDGSLWQAWIRDGEFFVAPLGNVFGIHRADALPYVSPEGVQMQARFDGGNLVLSEKGEAPTGGSTEMIAFRSWDGRPVYARILPVTVSGNVVVASASDTHPGPRFTAENGEIIDWQTSLVWKEGPDKDVTFDEAQAWIKGLGVGWRGPTQMELKAIFRRNEGGGLKGNMPAVFPKMGGTIVWAEENDPATAWYVGFIYGNTYTLGRGKLRFARVFAVRPR